MVGVPFVNQGGTPRKGADLTDTLTKRLTRWLTLRNDLRFLADVRPIHAHTARET